LTTDNSLTTLKAGKRYYALPIGVLGTKH